MGLLLLILSIVFTSKLQRSYISNPYSTKRYKTAKLSKASILFPLPPALLRIPLTFRADLLDHTSPTDYHPRPHYRSNFSSLHCSLQPTSPTRSHQCRPDHEDAAHDDHSHPLNLPSRTKVNRTSLDWIHSWAKLLLVDPLLQQLEGTPVLKKRIAERNDQPVRLILVEAWFGIELGLVDRHLDHSRRKGRGRIFAKERSHPNRKRKKGRRL